MKTMKTIASLCFAAASLVGGVDGAWAQTDVPWTQGTDVQTNPAPAKSNTTVIEREGGPKAGQVPGVRLVALLTVDGQQIDRGLVWRVFQGRDAQGKSKLITENREASPSLKLQPGDYTVNASFGRANLTRRIAVKANEPSIEQFVLNAGGLRLTALAGGKPAPVGAINYTILTDDRDQFANRTPVMTGAKPNLIIRLNAGIYHIVSTYGDANARIESDVTVEAGKLTEATIAHAAGKAMFKLVTRSGGEAIPDTAWTIQAAAGETVKESMGALPSHYLSPGAYTASARSGGQVYTSKFEIKDGDSTVVEVMKSGGAAVAPGVPPPSEDPPDAMLDLTPSLDFKNP